jgi:hypothetical protein
LLQREIEDRIFESTFRGKIVFSEVARMPQMRSCVSGLIRLLSGLPKRAP